MSFGKQISWQDGGGITTVEVGGFASWQEAEEKALALAIELGYKPKPPRKWWMFWRWFEEKK